MPTAPRELQSLLDKLANRSDGPKLKKAIAMLRADRFRLFSDITDEEVVGVIKSQGDPTLVYSCRLRITGTYSCCTQNLNVCGGLRGGVCKHILVLVIGLVQGGKLTEGQAVRWMTRAVGKSPELDKSHASTIFVRYKGAESGEVDWRPTETVPEDYYAL